MLRHTSNMNRLQMMQFFGGDNAYFCILQQNSWSFKEQFFSTQPEEKLLYFPLFTTLVTFLLEGSYFVANF